MRKSLLLLLLPLFLISGIKNQAIAQNTLKVRILDSASRFPVEFATISIKYIGETQAKRWASSDSTGYAIIKNAAVGRATVTIECVGYREYNGLFDVHRGDNDMGDVYLNGSNVLSSIVITAAGNQMLVKKDTIEYNANAFKTNETDMLEDLLKKLPGVEIDSDGTITANGETITKVMIDGKEFFMDDPQLASKNLPAKIIDKVKVVEKKSDEAIFTGIDDGEEETVLDLSFKAGMSDGWIGSIGGGYGSNNRYEGSLMIGRFSKNTQVSVIGNANNTNNRGFNDMAGSMMNTMMSGGGGGMGMGRGGGFAFTGNGVTASKMLGFNVNHDSDDSKWKTHVAYLYSSTNKDVEEEKEKTTILSETENQYNDESGKQNTVSHGHRFNAEIEYSPSDVTSFIFRPYVRFGNGNFDQSNNFMTSRNADPTNDGYSSSLGDNNSKELGGSLLYRQRLWKPGRTLTLRLSYSFSDNSLDGFNKSATNYYTDGSVSDSSIVNQQYHSNQKSNTFGVNFTYTEPLGKNYFIQGSYRYNLQHSNSLKNTYDYDDADQKYDLFNSEYSTDYKGDFITQRMEIALRKQEDKYNFMFGASLQPSYTKSVGEGRDTSYSVTNFAPSARLDYRISETKFLRVSYRGRTTQPTLNQLLPVPDNSDPLNVQEGNDKLNPSFTHSLNGEYRSNNRQKMSWFSIFAQTSYATKSIINQKSYTDDGVQHNKYINSDKGIYSFSSRVMWNSNIGSSDFSYNINGNFKYGNDISYVASGSSFEENETKAFNAGINLRLTYRIDNFEAIIGGGTNYNNAWYSVESLDKLSTWSSRINTSINWTFLETFNITTDITYRFYNGYSEGYGDARTIWNGEVSKTFWHNAFTFKVRVYDILDKSQNIYRNISENYVQDVRNNTLGRYVMFSLTYRFGSFGGKSARDSAGGGMRGPGGPPPGGGPGGPRR